MALTPNGARRPVGTSSSQRLLCAVGFVLVVGCAGLLAWRGLARPSSRGKEAASEDPAAARELREQARRLLARRDPDNALRLAGEAVRAAPGRVDGYVLRATILEGMGRLEEARRDLKSAHRLAPSDASITLEALRLTPPFTAYGEMEQLGREAVTAEPNLEDAHRYLATALANNPDPAKWPEACSEYAAAASLTLWDARPLIELGKVEARMGRDADAAGHLERAWRRLHEAPPPNAPSIRPYDLRSQQRATAFWLKQVYQRRRDPRLQEMSLALDRLNRQWEEEKALRQRGQAVPPDWDAKLRLARVALSDGELPMAERLAQEILAARPGDRDAKRVLDAAQAAERRPGS